jgi:hypothetical protein
MAKKATKAADNIYYKARMEAAATNDKLNSREGAAEVIGIDRTRLARIELDSICAYPEEVLIMSDIYNTPEIENYFCCEQCPIGKHSVPHLEIVDLDRLTIEILSSLKNVSFVKESLVDIVADGIISEDEKPALNDILDSLEKISVEAQKLKLWTQKKLIT